MKGLDEIKAENAEAQERSIQGALDRASELYPAIELRTPQRLHIFRSELGSDPNWEVWLDTEVTDFDGLCIGVAKTRDGAITAAVEVLECALEALQAPAPDFARRGMQDFAVAPRS